MKAIRYLHASDLHLDAPFLGICQRLPNCERLNQKLHDASFTALSRLESLCLEQQVDFLVLTGDLTNSEEQSIRARLALVSLCQKLAQAQIPVLMVCGKHDPLASAVYDLSWPENVTLFKDTMAQVPLRRQGDVYAIIHGLSLSKHNESRNLSQCFSRDQSHNDCFQLGLLHANVQDLEEDASCAPCTLSDLQNSGLDAWALGSLHKACILSDTPFIAYAGSLQGRASHESGNHGCYLIRAEKADGPWNCQSTFHALAPIVWQTVRVSVEGLQDIGQLRNHVILALEKARSELSAQVNCLIVRLVLTGSTGLNLEKQSTALLNDLVYLQNESPEIWIHDLRLETSPLVPLQRSRERDDLLGACLREAERIAKDSQAQAAFFDEALQELISASPLKKLLPPLDEQKRQQLLIDAQKICLARLEDGRVH